MSSSWCSLATIEDYFQDISYFQNSHPEAKRNYIELPLVFLLISV